MTVRTFWSDEDEAFISVDDSRPGCCAVGNTFDEARRELEFARKAWDGARRRADQQFGDKT